jgi:hypothetical protein
LEIIVSQNKMYTIEHQSGSAAGAEKSQAGKSKVTLRYVMTRLLALGILGFSPNSHAGEANLDAITAL